MLAKGFSSSGSPLYLGQKIHPILHTSSSAPPLRLCDIGVNILDEMFTGSYHSKEYHSGDRNFVLERSKALGVSSIICTATNLEESIAALSFCREVNGNNRSTNSEDQTISPFRLFSTVGVHPTRCDEIHEQEDSIEALSRIIENGVSDQTVVAIGECGLDYDRLFFCAKDIQIAGFKKQLDLIEKYKLPAFFHNRNTDGDFLRIVTEERHKIAAGGVVHSFTGSMEEMRSLVDLGLYIGINGCSLKNESNLEVAAAVPVEFLLIETDAPWCGIKPTHAGFKHLRTTFPTTKKEKFSLGTLVKDRNEPCALVQVLEVLAAVRGVEQEELAQQIWTNTLKLFPMPV
jgi:TatD DNase family protein